MKGREKTGMEKLISPISIFAGCWQISFFQMEILIREATADDATAIAGLSCQLGYPISAEATLQNLQAIFQHNDERVAIALYEAQVVGWIHVFQTTRLESGTFCEIGGLVVDDEHRRSGIGKEMIKYIKQWCIGKGILSLRVRCNIKRTDAHAFYLQSGFHENKQQKVFEMDLK